MQKINSNRVKNNKKELKNKKYIMVIPFEGLVIK